MAKCTIKTPNGEFNSGTGPAYIDCVAPEDTVKRYRHPQGHYFHMCDTCKERIWPHLNPVPKRSAFVTLKDGTKTHIHGVEADITTNPDVLADMFICTAHEQGKEVATVDVIYNTPPMKDPYFVVNRAPDDFVIHDHAIWDGSSEYKGRFSGKTLAEMQSEDGEPKIELMEWDEAWPLYEKAQQAKYIGPVKEVDEDRFWYLLEVLPPVGWVNNRSSESFKLCERLSGSITTIAARIGGKYYEFNDDIMMPHDKIVAKIEQAIKDDTITKDEK